MHNKAPPADRDEALAVVRRMRRRAELEVLQEVESEEPLVTQLDILGDCHRHRRAGDDVRRHHYRPNAMAALNKTGSGSRTTATT